MIIQGPLFPFFKKKNPLGLRLYGSVINGEPPVDNKRIDAWIRTGVHVRGCENWIIVKVHPHGAVESDAVLGNEIDRIFNYLETNYNDGEHRFLHYVTARELYNIIKSIEAGEPLTNPQNYKNYKIKAPEYDASPKIPEVSNYLKELILKTYVYDE
jgi:hypothetical protein